MKKRDWRLTPEERIADAIFHVANPAFIAIILGVAVVSLIRALINWIF